MSGYQAGVWHDIVVEEQHNSIPSAEETHVHGGGDGGRGEPEPPNASVSVELLETELRLGRMLRRLVDDDNLDRARLQLEKMLDRLEQHLAPTIRRNHHANRGPSSLTL